MTLIHILDSPPSHPLLPVPADWYPLFVNRKYFHDLRISWRFFTKPDPSLTQCDYLFLSSRYFSLQSVSPDQHTRHLSFLASLRRPGLKIFWFDFRDSTGNTQFEVLPHVDLYLKKQLLRDLSLYSRTYYGNRLYTDFLHRTQGVADDYTEPCVPLLPQFLSKLKISWNPGLLDFRGGLKWQLARQLLSDRWESFFPHDHRIAWHSPLAPRPYNLLARFNTSYRRRTVSWQRRQLPRLLAALPDPTIISRQYMSLAAERSYRRQVKIILSLFGWGEICSCDFQTWIAGAALIAPDSSHLVTYPITHIAGTTYLPIKWDLSDFTAVYQHLLADNALRLNIAQAGQQLYRSIWSDTGRQQFVQHINNLLHLPFSSTSSSASIDATKQIAKSSRN